jgi:hypothetical protein
MLYLQRGNTAATLVSDSEELIYRFFVENGAVSHAEVGAVIAVKSWSWI